MNDVTNKDLCVLSLGAGVQSTTMALMAAQGEFDKMPDCAIFADTGYEPAGVYTHLDWLEAQLPFPVHRVTAGNIKDDHLDGINTTGQRFASMPLFTEGGAWLDANALKNTKFLRSARKLVSCWVWALASAFRKSCALKCG